MSEQITENITSLSMEDNYGDITFTESSLTDDSNTRKWSEATEGKKLTLVRNLVKEIDGSEVLIRGQVDTNRELSKTLFLILRQGGKTVQCVAKKSKLSENMIKFINQLSLESYVEVIGLVSVPQKPITGTTQQVEIQVNKVFCIHRSSPDSPLLVEDAARSKADIERSLLTGRPAATVNQDTRLNNRVLDLRTPANQAIFCIEFQVENRIFTIQRIYWNPHTEIDSGSSEGGSAVFRLDYKGKPACLAQSPQLHKQMVISAGFMRVFEVGPVFRAEDSDTHRHLCELTGLDAEMVIYKDYSEIMDLVDELFVFIFTKLNERCNEELEAVRKQFPFEPLKFLPKTLRITFEQGIQMLKEAGVEVDPLGDLNTESERKLGQLVLQKYNTEFFIMNRYPLGVRPFYTMPCANDSRYSNSFDVFIRGEEIISGAQRIHTPEFLKKRAKERGIDVETISTYIDSFSYGTPPHGGFGVGLERVVMLFCGLDNIRKTSLFPRDPHRLIP